MISFRHHFKVLTRNHNSCPELSLWLDCWTISVRESLGRSCGTPRRKTCGCEPQTCPIRTQSLGVFGSGWILPGALEHTSANTAVSRWHWMKHRASLRRSNAGSSRMNWQRLSQTLTCWGSISRQRKRSALEVKKSTRWNGPMTCVQCGRAGAPAARPAGYHARG